MNRAKVELFIKNWDKFCVNLLTQSKKSKDSKISNFAQQVLKIPTHIKEAVAENFVRACIFLHAHVFAIFRSSFRHENCYSTEAEL